jgi:hypothetical protein
VRFLIIFDGMMKAKIGISWVDILTTGSVADERWRRMAEIPFGSKMAKWTHQGIFKVNNRGIGKVENGVNDPHTHSKH